MKQTLLVSDDQDHLDKKARILESMGWETHVATTTELVSEVCKSHLPSLIVADVEMEGGRGFESIAVARNKCSTSFIVAVTRGDNKDLWEKVAVVCGANEYVVGPVSAPKLSAAIGNGITAGLVGG